MLLNTPQQELVVVQCQGIRRSPVRVGGCFFSSRRSTAGTAGTCFWCNNCWSYRCRICLFVSCLGYGYVHQLIGDLWWFRFVTLTLELNFNTLQPAQLISFRNNLWLCTIVLVLPLHGIVQQIWSIGLSTIHWSTLRIGYNRHQPTITIINIHKPSLTISIKTSEETIGSCSWPVMNRDQLIVTQFRPWLMNHY